MDDQTERQTQSQHNTFQKNLVNARNLNTCFTASSQAQCWDVRCTRRRQFVVAPLAFCIVKGWSDDCIFALLIQKLGLYLHHPKLVFLIKTQWNNQWKFAVEILLSVTRAFQRTANTAYLCILGTLSRSILPVHSLSSDPLENVRKAVKILSKNATKWAMQAPSSRKNAKPTRCWNSFLSF